jgi:hypothetical protein
MKQVHRFIADFVGYFIIILGSLAIATVQASTQLLHMLQRLMNIMFFNMVEVLMDVQFICAIMCMLVLASVSGVCLALSKWLLMLAQKTHAQAEQITHALWMQ